jgi:hypothetical protein
MLSAARKDMIGATMYIAGFESIIGDECTREIYPCEPCPICERMIRNAGISRVITTSSIFENTNGRLVELCQG